MAIYRGPGGAGDAVADTTNQSEAAQVAAAAAQAAAAGVAASASAAATSATNAATSASAASTSATNAASSASSASTSASNASTSATNAANSATTAGTSATNASNSATAAASSASDASDSATAAASSASAASTSASNASTSATNAANSATAASNSATAAAASYDSFDDRYLGAKSSAPSTDNDGDALVTGALYYNTSLGQLYVWDGSQWDEAAFSVSGAVTSFNTRTGAVTLSSADVTTALGYTPVNKAGDTLTGALTAPQMTVSANVGRLSINSTSSIYSRIDFGDAADSDIGMIYYDHPNNAMKFYTNNTEQMAISNAGVLSVGGNTVLTDASDYLDSADIGSTVLAYDSNLQSFVTAFTLPTVDGSADQVLKTDGAGNIGFATVSASGTPGGSDTQLQYNSSGSFAGASGLVTDGSNLTINAQGDLRFADSDSSNWVAFQAPATIASNVTWTLPSADGTDGQVIKTNGSGTLSWVDQSGGGGGGGTSVTVTQATATASQTTFSVTYTVGQLSVYLNGALLSSSDYTASNGTSVVLASGAASGDIFTAVAYSTVAGLEIDSATPFLTAVGSGAGAVTTGVRNTFVGFEAGNDNTTGANNNALGAYALDASTTGARNIAIGTYALTNATTANDNTAIGYDALGTNTLANGNTAVGAYAMNLSNDASGNNYNNTALGYLALSGSLTGRDNIGIGKEAGDTITSGGFNIAIGTNAIGTGAGCTGSYNVAIGTSALGLNTSGANNTAVGYGALDANTTGSHSTAIGYNAGTSSTTVLITAIGAFAGENVTTGDENICVGYQAGNAITTGGKNTVLGQYSDPASATSSGEIVIGYNITGKGNATGFISPNTGGAANGMYQGNNSSSWSTTSDQRLKKNIVDNTDGLNKINALRVRNFEYRLPEEVDPELKPSDAINKKGIQLGVIAQEIQQVCPDCVKEESTGVLSVDSDNVFWHMVNAIKELSAKCDSLQAEINTLKGQ